MFSFIINLTMISQKSIITESESDSGLDTATRQVTEFCKDQSQDLRSYQ